MERTEFNDNQNLIKMFQLKSKKLFKGSHYEKDGRKSARSASESISIQNRSLEKIVNIQTLGDKQISNLRSFLFEQAYDSGSDD